MTHLAAPIVSGTPLVTIVMPCLNEVETLAACLQKADRGLKALNLLGEIIVADNGSIDGSQELAAQLGARVIHVPEKGYGSAIRGGIHAARGEWIIMGDADDSYDFSDLQGFAEKMAAGYDLVMGCRLPAGGGTIMPGAMPWKNRWIGNPILSFLGRLFFQTPIHDFHCGLRAFRKQAYIRMDVQTTGMEFASEMVMKATIWKMRIAEVPITLHPDGRNRPPHLRPWRDGWRHLRFMLIYSPQWLFLSPGLLLFALSTLVESRLMLGPWKLGAVTFDTGVLMVASMGLMVGVQLTGFAVSTKIFAIGEGLLPPDGRLSRLFLAITLEKGLIAGVALLMVGLFLLFRALEVWGAASFGHISYPENMRRLIPATTCLMVGIQVVFNSFFLSVLGLKTVRRTPPGAPEE